MRPPGRQIRTPKRPDLTQRTARGAPAARSPARPDGPGIVVDRAERAIALLRPDERETTVEERFAYAPRRVNQILAYVLGVLITVVGAYGLATGGVISRRGMELSPGFSLVVFVFLLVVGVGMIVWGVRMTMAGRREIIVSPHGIDAPVGVASRRRVQIPAATIRNVTASSDPGQGQMLVIVADGASNLRLARNGFADAAAFAACHQAVERLRHGTPNPEWSGQPTH